MVMKSRDQHLETLSEIRNMMERSSRFISLSGLSGIAAGIAALIGAAMVYIYLDITPFDSQRLYYVQALTTGKWGIDYITFFFLDAALVLFVALAAGVFFTTRKAKKTGHKIWDKSSKRLLINMAIPLVTGGIFCLSMLKHGMFGFGLLAPATLIFYGLACVNASKYTLDDIRYLGIMEIILGLIAINFIGYGLEFWAIGFGVLHIIYGARMYFKYER